MNSEDKRTQILRLLEHIELEKDIKIIHAIESGSRAWGFPSEDSDFDIRIVYHHPLDWYISPFHKKDVIEDIFIDDLDVGGWDIGKCLNLMYKGNAALVEWLNSPIVYKTDPGKTDILNKIAIETFNPKLIFFHYISLAKKKLEDDYSNINPKSFLYAFRALLCAKWTSENHSAPPVLFSQLYEYYLSNEILNLLISLIAEKQGLGEKDEYQIPKELFIFAKEEYVNLSKIDVPAKRILDMATYDVVLKTIVS